jgi:hypothetical protein
MIENPQEKGEVIDPILARINLVQVTFLEAGILKPGKLCYGASPLNVLFTNIDPVNLASTAECQLDGKPSLMARHIETSSLWPAIRKKIIEKWKDQIRPRSVYSVHHRIRLG